MNDQMNSVTYAIEYNDEQANTSANTGESNDEYANAIEYNDRRANTSANANWYDKHADASTSTSKYDY